MKILLVKSQKVLIGNNSIDHSERTIEFSSRAALNSYLNNNFPTGKLVNIPLAMHGELQFNGKSIWRRHKKYVKGDLVSITIEKGSLTAVYDSCGNKIYPLPESRYYHVHVIDWIDNKDCSSPQLRQKHLRIRNKSSLTQFVSRNIRNCTVTNFPLGKRGAMHFLGNRFWDTLAGCKEHDLVTIEIKEKCVTCILDAAGKRPYPFNDGLYQLYVNDERSNIRFRDKTDLGKYILKKVLLDVKEVC